MLVWDLLTSLPHLCRGKLDTGGPKSWGSSQSLPGISQNQAGETTSPRGEKRLSRLQHHHCQCAGKSREQGGEPGSARTTAQPDQQPPQSSRPLGRRRGHQGEASGEPAAYFPGAQLSMPPHCRAPPTALALSVLPASSGRSPAQASTPASLGRHRAACLQNKQQPPLTRETGPANSFPSNPALPPLANWRRGRRAPLPCHVTLPGAGSCWGRSGGRLGACVCGLRRQRRLLVVVWQSCTAIYYYS